MRRPNTLWLPEVYLKPLNVLLLWLEIYKTHRQCELSPINHTLLKRRLHGANFVADSMDLVSVNLTRLAAKTAVRWEISRNDDRWAVPGHSRSVMSNWLWEIGSFPTGDIVATGCKTCVVVFALSDAVAYSCTMQMSNWLQRNSATASLALMAARAARTW